MLTIHHLNAAALSLALIAIPTLAHAAPDAEPPATAASQPDRPQPTEPKEPERKTLALEVNPIGVVIGRYSVSAEWLPMAHHALELNPHFDYVSADVSLGRKSYTEKFVGGGAELGYRFYTASKAPAGFFVGPSLLLAGYSATESATNSKVSFMSIGGALDIGGQAVIGPGIVIGGGAGLQYTKATKDVGDGLPLSAAVIAGGGFRPRLLLSLGYAI